MTYVRNKDVQYMIKAILKIKILLELSGLDIRMKKIWLCKVEKSEGAALFWRDGHEIEKKATLLTSQQPHRPHILGKSVNLKN